MHIAVAQMRGFGRGREVHGLIIFLPLARH
jgi:hypothetical protein